MTSRQKTHIQELIQSYRNGAVDRRSFLRKVVGLGVTSSVAYSLLQQANFASAQQVFSSTPTTMALGEEGTSGRQPHVEQQNVTTRALGEEQTPQPTTSHVGEESPTVVHPPGQMTTHAIGEETQPQPNPTTLRVGEEHPQPQPHPQPTTAMVGEEGGTVTTQAIGEETQPIPQPVPQPTTQAVGEEGPTVVHPPGQITTYALGEEGSTTPPPGTCPHSHSQPRPWNGWRRW